MLLWLENFLIRYPELALFLVIAVGYWIGSLKIGPFNVGPVTGALFAGLVLGHFVRVPVSSMTKSFLFLLFLFGIGYSVGPQFIQAMKRGGLKPMILAVVVSLTGLAAALGIAKLLQLDAGYAAGLLSGALTQSAAMGTATDAVNGLSLSEAERGILVAHIAVADAVCYIFGYAGVILFLTEIAPRLLGIDLRAEARNLEQQLGMGRAKAGLASAWRKFEMRAYRLEGHSALIGQSVASAEAREPAQRLFIHRLRRGDSILDPGPETRLEDGDVIALSGPRQSIVELVGPRGTEVEDRELLDVPVAALDVLLTRSDVANRTLDELSHEHWARGVYLRSLSRGGQELPVGSGVVLQRGDVLSLVGQEARVQAAAAQLGSVISPNSTIDFTVLGLAIFFGGLVGVIATFSVGAVNISLSTSVGTLLAGLLVGYLRTRHPLFGRIPPDAVGLMTTLGLAAFVGLTGIQAGPNFIAALREAGIGLLFGGMVVTILPQLVGLAFGHFVLRMNPVLLLGALAGSQTVTAALAAVQERSGSPVAVLGYTPSYPAANILLTTWGSVVILVFAG